MWYTLKPVLGNQNPILSGELHRVQFLKTNMPTNLHIVPFRAVEDKGRSILLITESAYVYVRKKCSANLSL